MVAPWRRLGPITSARCGSQSTIRAPIAIRLSTKNRRLSKSFSWINTVPSHCVASTSASGVRSAGKPGHGASSTFGIAPSISATMERFCPAGTRSVVPSIRVSTPSRAKTMRIIRRWSGAMCWTRNSPPVMAATATNDPTSM